MKQLLADATFAGIVLTLGAYMLGVLLKRKLRLAIFNPMLIALACVMLVLGLGGFDYNRYLESCTLLNVLVTPATVCFAIPLYRQLVTLRKNARAILGGIAAGVLTSGVSVYAVARLFGFSAAQYATLLPKSITTAIGMDISGELGGIVTITVAAIMVTGIFGNMVAESLCRLLRITEPVAQGVAIGTASHIMGTARALEMGEVQGAMSSLAIVVGGLLTVLAAPLFFTLPL